ncbi:acyltransferase [Parapedobacter sp. DT-150]|uniref:acyltransferase n=1 Tax=Parapedobacter sp. DT-150 TaxID=3396162 RepID=UPI003F1D37CB
MRERDYSFDVLRGIAILGVVFIHVTNITYKDNLSGLNFYLCVALKQAVNFSVPLFLFISGFFMAKKEVKDFNSYKRFLYKQLPRIFIPFLVWSSFYSVFNYYQNGDILSVFINFITFQSTVPFYFICLIIQYYILLPLIVYLGKSLKGVMLSLIVSLFCCQVVEILHYKFSINLPLIVYAGNFLMWLVFPVLGIYFNKNTKSEYTKSEILLWVTVVLYLVQLLHTFWLANSYEEPKLAAAAGKISSFLYSISAILFLYSIKEKLNRGIFMVKMGLASFGIFFSHMLVLMSIGVILNKIISLEVQQHVIIQVVETITIAILCYLFGKVSVKILGKENAAKYLGF